MNSNLVSDVPVGLFLSGGLDSSSVAAMMREATDGPVRAYSIGFDVPEHTETHYAASSRTGSVSTCARERWLSTTRSPRSRTSHGSTTNHRGRLVAPDLPRRRARSGRREGDVVRRRRRRGVRWLLVVRRVASLGARGRTPSPLRRTASKVATLPRLRDVTWFRDLDAAPLERYAAFIELFPPAMALGLLSPDVAGGLEGRDPRWHLREHWHEDLDPLTRAQVLDPHTYLPGDILTKVDRASMAVSLEVGRPYSITSSSKPSCRCPSPFVATARRS